MNFRKYGKSPYKAIVLHGGPGAPGTAAGICKGLCNEFGVIEHLQLSYSVNGLMSEILKIFEQFNIDKTVLIGHSYGAWLALLFAEKYPEKVAKVIIVGCGPLEQKYLQNIIETRNERMEKGVDTELYCPLPGSGGDMLYFDEEQHKTLMKEATDMRVSGQLLSAVLRVSCPIVAIHGNYDPHPIDGLLAPINDKLSNFKLEVLDKCGHEPWVEKYARDRFFNIVKEELNNIVL